MNTSVIPSNISSSTLVKTGAGRVYGFYVNSTSSGTIKFWDNVAGSGTVLFNTITPSAGMHNFGHGVRFQNGLYATIGNTMDVTILYS